MSIVGCHRIVLKVLQYILSRHICLEKVSGDDTGPEIGVTFIAGNEDLCTHVEVSYCGLCEIFLDVRCFVKAIGEELNIVKELQLKVAGSCLSASEVYKDMRKLYIFYYNSHVGWELRLEEEQFLHEHKEMKPYISVSVNVNLPISVAKNLHDSVLPFLKKCQLTMPYLTVFSKMNEDLFRRSGIHGLQKDENWCKNVSLYLRAYGQADLPAANGVKYKLVRVKRTASYQCPSFSIVYGSTLGADIGKENHLHMLLFSEHGVPMFVESRTWQDVVSLPAAIDKKATLQAGPCTQGLIDVCYCVTNDGPTASYFIIFLTKDEDHMKRLMEEQSSLIASTVMKTIREMTAAVIAHENDKKWSHMMAKSVGSIIRFSRNNEFRKECLRLLQATDSMDAEVIFEHRLLNELQH